ncbi:hypothetical protein [Shewanella salipaludis]|uniref:UDP-2,3-diacylglucosamine diphosphatase n=1 Tax=Shewanella salipaludis TaxID=2723052 RepID=A0A972FQT5_9GAMM|nr:hypothetical protein [Shewanella salipaludis]
MPLSTVYYCQLPRQARQGIADKLRNKSKQSKQSNQSNQNKSYSIMDVAPESVDALMRQTGAELMIHGHTHRPAIHKLTHDRRRLVVGDWYQQGSVLSITPDSASLDVLPFDGACP